MAFNFMEIFQQASKMKEEVQRIQDELATKSVEAAAGGGMVKVTVNGKQQILKIEIDPAILGDRDLVQDLVKAGVNQAILQSHELARDEMTKLMGGLGPLASLFKGFGNGGSGS